MDNDEIEKISQKGVDRFVPWFILLIGTQENLIAALSLLCKDRILADKGLRNQSLVFYKR